jgi:serine/threonine-protein phosphatase 2A activator
MYSTEEIATQNAHEITFSSSTHGFVIPRKYIHDAEDITTFLSSEGYLRLMSFIEKVNEAVLNKTILGTKLPTTTSDADLLLKLQEILRTMKMWINEYPPLPQPMRFGNKAFRQWMQRMETETESLLKDMIPSPAKPALVELSPYFKGSFGNAVRIDYGTGHELSFIAFLACLDQLDIFSKQDPGVYTYLGLVVFNDYLSLVHQLQSVLEPAGSHGVWGLDDYQFMPFLWGSSQLISHPSLNPSSVLSNAALDTYADDFLYFAAIRFITTLKHGPFHEHSPMLYDISGVPSWEKINQGLKKLLIAEILKKVPIMQHFVFGNLLPYKSVAPIISSELKHA